jgi:phosphopantothenoylcysteine decarboxylase/phosphopantothenate--cysteine ligase
MGFALADEAAARGARVTVVAANVALSHDPRLDVVAVETAAQLQAACEARFEDADVLLMAGLAARRRPGQTLVGFAAETGAQAVAYGRGKLAAKSLDAVVVNDVAAPGAGFDVPTNEVTIVSADDEQHVALASKGEIAAAVLDAVMALRARLAPQPAGEAGR